MPPSTTPSTNDGLQDFRIGQVEGDLKSALKVMQDHISEANTNNQNTQLKLAGIESDLRVNQVRMEQQSQILTDIQTKLGAIQTRLDTLTKDQIALQNDKTKYVSMFAGAAGVIAIVWQVLSTFSKFHIGM